MRKIFFLPVSIIIMLMATALQHPDKNLSRVVQVTSNSLINPSGKNIRERILTPEGYERIPEEEHFTRYLRDLPLKPHGSDVHLYNGQVKTNRVHVAVIDMDIGNRDLQQCADAVIRLRSEYLFANKRYGQIHFNFTNGFRADYLKWANGYRIEVRNSQARWVGTASVNFDYEVFRDYLDIVFTYAGTYSLEKEMVKTVIQNIRPGDVFIKGGSPGHAVIVVDVAVNPATGKKIFLLAQSFMPAQDIHMLINPADTELSPWYEADPSAKQINTPEWDFYTNELRRFN
jgi:hypothetical protein